MVLVHGSMSSATQWNGYAELLPDFELVVPDLPGHGSRSSESFSTVAALKVLDEAVLGSVLPTFLVGHSLGGYLSTTYAASNSGRISGLALLGASANPNSRLSVLYSGFARLAQKVDQGQLGRVRTKLARQLGVTAVDLPEKINYQMLPQVWGSVIEDFRPSQLRNVTCPVVIINGQFDQMRLNAKLFSILAGDAPVITIPGASHLAPLTHKEVVAAQLNHFVTTWTAGEGRQLEPPTN